MKRLLIIAMILGAAALLFNSCNPYEEGPAISLLSKTARVTGDWVLDKTYIDGTERAADSIATEMTIEKDGTGSVKIPFFGVSLSIDFEWEFDTDKENLRMRIQNPTTDAWESWEESKILMLTNDEMWLEYTGTDEDSGLSYTQKDIWVAK